MKKPVKKIVKRKSKKTTKQLWAGNKFPHSYTIMVNCEFNGKEFNTAYMQAFSSMPANTSTVVANFVDNLLNEFYNRRLKEFIKDNIHEQKEENTDLKFKLYFGTDNDNFKCVCENAMEPWICYDSLKPVITSGIADIIRNKLKEVELTKG